MSVRLGSPCRHRFPARGERWTERRSLRNGWARAGVSCLATNRLFSWAGVETVDTNAEETVEIPLV